jgi:hypothetical protein
VAFRVTITQPQPCRLQLATFQQIFLSTSCPSEVLIMVKLSFPITRDNWSLDVVNILAFLGKHNILATSQQIGLSWFCFLPRLIPAPQGLLAQRPSKLPDKDNMDVIGRISGERSPVCITLRTCYTETGRRFRLSPRACSTFAFGQAKQNAQFEDACCRLST